MKKDYVKPEIHYESFVLSQNIAACGIDMNYQNPDSCSGMLDSDFYPNSNDIVFNSGVSDCKIPFESYCYTNGTDTAKLFNS